MLDNKQVYPEMLSVTVPELVYLYCVGTVPPQKVGRYRTSTEGRYRTSTEGRYRTYTNTRGKLSHRSTGTVPRSRGGARIVGSPLKPRDLLGRPCFDKNPHKKRNSYMVRKTDVPKYREAALLNCWDQEHTRKKGSHE